jgi:hypothetical protein
MNYGSKEFKLNNNNKNSYLHLAEHKLDMYVNKINV